ncbi:MAG: OadG family protein [Prevotella sp.]|nr:OadG family protein [Prevotella sp.]MCI7496444.1 OadG family protein [Prevotella sp.]MDD7507891.1 OadG family protein [Prevotella sp.]MDY2804884.1 OadG family protein [Prevotella sp.]MDY3966316.1 OadG family protein [Prevotella sp.]
MENLGLGLTLMLIGMVTVFAILMIVIALSNALIRIVNKVCPAEEAPKKAPARQATVDSAVMDVINAAVAQITAGKGRVTKVERI